MRRGPAISVMFGIGLAAGLVGFAAGGKSAKPNRVEASRSAALQAGDGGSVGHLLDDGDSSGVDPEVVAWLEGNEVQITAGNYRALFSQLAEIAGAGKRSQMMYELLAKLDGEQVGELIEDLMEDDGGDFHIDDLFEDEIEAYALFDRWVDLDPEAVVRFLQSPAKPKAPGEWFNTEMMMRMLTLAFLAQRDPEQALAIYDEQRLTRGKEDDSKELDDVVIYGVSFGDPGEAMALFLERGMPEEWDIEEVLEMAGARAGEALDEVLALPSGEQRDELLDALFESWASKAPQDALAAVDGLRGEESYDELMLAAIRGYGESDPREALVKLDREELGEAGEVMALQIAQSWAGSDPRAALLWAQGNLEGRELAGLLQHAAKDVDPRLALQLVESMDDEARALVFRNASLNEGQHFVRRLAFEDPEAAVALLVDNADLGEMRIAGFGRAVAQRDVAIAQGLVQTLPASGFRDEFLREVVSESARINPGEAAGWAETFSGKDRSLAMVALVSGWAEDDPRAASEYALSTGDPQVAGKAVRQWAETDAGEAYGWLVASHDGDPQAILDTLKHSDLVDAWSSQDPAAAARAMIGFPEELAPRQVASVIGAWAASEPLRASAFINDDLEPGRVRDEAVAALVGQIKDDDLASAAAWAQTIDDDGVRHSVLESLATE